MITDVSETKSLRVETDTGNGEVTSLKPTEVCLRCGTLRSLRALEPRPNVESSSPKAPPSLISDH